MPVIAAVIGDLVGSRRSPDRTALHQALTGALAEHSAHPGVLAPARVTVGDEFQATCTSVGAALDLAWRLHLDLAPEVDIRFGVGWGEVTALDEDVQDGPGWWAARAAIVEVAARQGNAGSAHLRTCYRLAETTDGPDEAAVNAALGCRDHLVGSLDDRSRRLLRGLTMAMSRTALAAEEGISVSAVSQRVRRDGLEVLVRAAADLADVGAGLPG